MSAPDWTKLSFGLQHTAPCMWRATWTEVTGWVTTGCEPYGNLSMPPAAQVRPRPAASQRPARVLWELLAVSDGGRG